ncbi:MAG: hypothetical protein M0R23_01485 [Bacteroidales bacterium]|jgi:PBP1b-binding outer membrane lipoprotein LpoB|nr:hypothetical protein [Bacteroidales bacterium]
MKAKFSIFAVIAICAVLSVSCKNQAKVEEVVPAVEQTEVTADTTSAVVDSVAVTEAQPAEVK